MFVCKLSDKLATVELFFMATQAVKGGNPLGAKKYLQEIIF